MGLPGKKLRAPPTYPPYTQYTRRSVHDTLCTPQQPVLPGETSSTKPNPSTCPHTHTHTTHMCHNRPPPRPLPSVAVLPTRRFNYIGSPSKRVSNICACCYRNYTYQECSRENVVITSSSSPSGVNLGTACCLHVDADTTCFDPAFATFVEFVDYGCLAVFLIEMCLKMFAYGLFWARTAYFRDGWNVLDFATIVPGVFALFTAGASVSALRTFRVLRPLKAMTKFVGMRQVVATLINSLPDIGAVAVLMFFVVLLFATVGLHIWSGRMWFQCHALNIHVVGLSGATLVSAIPGLNGTIGAASLALGSVSQTCKLSDQEDIVAIDPMGVLNTPLGANTNTTEFVLWVDFYRSKFNRSVAAHTDENEWLNMYRAISFGKNGTLDIVANSAQNAGAKLKLPAKLAATLQLNSAGKLANSMAFWEVSRNGVHLLRL